MLSSLDHMNLRSAAAQLASGAQDVNMLTNSETQSTKLAS